MLINLLKFLHVLLALGLLAAVIFCITKFFDNPFSEKHLRTINKALFVFSLLALFTGALLVQPKHFTFQTPWIEAAFLFTVLAGLLFGLLAFCKNTWILRSGYFALLIIFIGVIHDAVTKTTFIF